VRSRVGALVFYSIWCVSFNPCGDRRSPCLLWQKRGKKPYGQIVGHPYVIQIATWGSVPRSRLIVSNPSGHHNRVTRDLFPRVLCHHKLPRSGPYLRIAATCRVSGSIGRINSDFSMIPAQIRKVADDSLPIDPFLPAEHSLRSPRSWKYEDSHEAIVCLPAAPMEFCIPIARETRTTSHTE
jgi:hypothetical protein